MRWPLLAGGILLLAMGIRPAMGWTCSASPLATSRTAWLLLVPTVVVFAVSPPPLGAFLAEHRANQPASIPEPAVADLPPSTGPVPLSVGEFVWAASEPDDPMGISNRQVTMSGFVSGTDDEWYLTRLEIACCAADATVMRVRISGPKSPPRDQWVEVTGTWVEGTGGESATTATLQADQVVAIEEPMRAYG